MAKNTEWIQLQEDLRPHLPKLSQAADTVMNEEVSNYPVFLTYAATEDEALQLGIPVFTAPTARGREWNVHVTTLEELATKGIVLREKVDDFIKVYKSNAGQLCFLIYTDGEARFGFLAR